VSLPDIVTGINRSVASRVSSLARRAGVADDVVITGGCYNNEGLITALELALGLKIKKLPLNPQFMGALGAAVFAQNKAAKSANAPSV